MERKTVWFMFGLLIGAMIGIVVCVWLDATLHMLEGSPSALASSFPLSI